jgi:hypothetical protein
MKASRFIAIIFIMSLVLFFGTGIAYGLGNGFKGMTSISWAFLTLWEIILLTGGYLLAEEVV